MHLHRTIYRIGFVVKVTFTGYDVHSQCMTGKFSIATAFDATFQIHGFSFIVLSIWLAIKCS